MKHNHAKHEHCEHRLAYCEKCDVAYCVYSDCKREWSDCKLSHSYYPWYPYTTTITSPSNDIYWTGAVGSTAGDHGISSVLTDQDHAYTHAYTRGSCPHATD